MKICLTIVLLLAVLAIIVSAKSKSSKSKPAESSRTVQKETYSKKTAKTYSKAKKPSATKDLPQITKSKSQKASKVSRDEPEEETQPNRYQTKRQAKVQPERVVYEEDFVYEERYPSDTTSYQKTYRKQEKKVRGQKYDCSGSEETEETLPAIRGARSCGFHHDGSETSGGCPYQGAISKMECGSCAGQPSPVVCSQPPVMPSCPYANTQPPCPPCNQPQPTPTQACPCAAASPSPSPAQTQSQQPQTYPTININTYSGTPVIKDSAKDVNESVEDANTTEDDANVEEEVAEDEEDEEVTEPEEEVKEYKEVVTEERTTTGKYSSCANPVLSEQVDDGYCYRTEL